MNETRSATSGPNERPASCAVVSSDAVFVKDLLSSEPFERGEVSVEAQISLLYPDITDTDLEELRALDLDIVILDLESDLPIGLRFAEFLGDLGIGRVLLASAPPQPPDVLLDVMHAGISDFMPKPLTALDLDKALQSARRRLGRSDPSRSRSTPGELLVFIGARGGTGCTTLCTNTAVDVHRASRKRTLLVDFDLEMGDAALQLGEESRFTMVDLVRNFHRVDSDLLASYIGHHASGIDLLSAPYRPAPFEPMSADLVTQILAFVQTHYDYVFVDVPRTLSPATIAALEAADHLFLVTTSDLPGVRSVTRRLPFLQELSGERGDDWIRLVVNRFDPRGLISAKQIEETVSHPVFATVRDDHETVMQGINDSTPAVTLGTSDFAEDVRMLAAQIAELQLEARSGWLRGLVRSLRPTAPGRKGHHREARARA
jgi:pilus assembly protein CpaE